MMDGIVGFTGTRKRVLPLQRFGLRRLLRCLFGMGHRRFVHGCCKGADWIATEIAYEMGYVIEGYPSNLRNFVDVRSIAACDWIHMPRPPLDRNALIIHPAHVVVGVPATEEEEVRSGTWATIRLARKAAKPLVLVYPDGSQTYENWIR